MGGLNYGRAQRSSQKATSERVIGEGSKMPAQPSRSLIARPLELPPMRNVKGDLPPELAPAEVDRG